jgi:hypothetical protein
VNRDLPRCERCEGMRFFRVTHVVDATVPREPDCPPSVWRARPVGVRLPMPSEASGGEPFGRFETFVCRGCGLTTWYAHDWAAAPGTRSSRRCGDCDRETQHLRVDAHEHCVGGFEPVRFTRGALGREGFLFSELCERCGLAAWKVDDYQHLGGGGSTSFVWAMNSVFIDLLLSRLKSYALRTEPARPCLSCGGVEAIVDDKLEEYQGTHVPVALLHAPRSDEEIQERDMVGHFALRLCRPCGALEWYARDIDRLAHDPAAGIFAIGDTPEAVSQGGPYR